MGLTDKQITLLAKCEEFDEETDKLNDVDWTIAVRALKEWGVYNGYPNESVSKALAWRRENPNWREPVEAPKIEVEKPKFIPASTARGEGGFYQSLGE